MNDEIVREGEVTRSEFLRRTGALGLAGAAALGYPLLEARHAGAAPLRPPRDVIAAGGGATIKLGHIDSFSGVYAVAGESQQNGIQAAIDEANRKNSRVQFAIVRGDDTSVPAVGNNEAKRLISQEKVDVLMGGLSSAVGLAVSATAEENGVLFLAIGTHDTNITGPKANRVCFRATCSNAMLANAIGPALLKKGKRWYFLTADYAFGNDAHDRLSKILRAAGGAEVGNDKHPLGQVDYSSYLTRARNTDANVLVFCNYGPDTQNASKQAVNLGIHKQMAMGGIIYDILKARATGFPTNWRQYLGYIAGEQMCDRILAAGTTDAEKLVETFEGHRYDAGKKSLNYWRKCDHQAVQETYAGVIVPKSRRRSTDEYFVIGSAVGGDFAAESCSNPDSTKAAAIIGSQKIPARADYTPVKTG